MDEFRFVIICSVNYSEANMKKKLSFVIPCYCSEQTISGIVERILITVQNDQRYLCEIILINDASKDQTWKVLVQLSERFSNVKVINLAKNFGQQAAIMAGFRHVTGDFVICLDDDGQTPPENCMNLVDKLNEGYDLVFAKYEHKKHSFFRNFGSRLNSIMAEFLIGKPKGIDFSSYFVCRKFVVEEAVLYKNAYPYVGGLFLRATDKVSYVSMPHYERLVGNSGYSIKKLISLWLNGFTAFSVKPLRVATLMGLFFSAIGYAYTFWIIVKKLLNPMIPIGWTSTMAAILVVGGMILFVLGLIGEYVGRIYICINNAPQYVIREKINIIEMEEK